MARPHGGAQGSSEDVVVLRVLIVTLAFLMFMMSVPIWLSSFVRGLSY